MKRAAILRSALIPQVSLAQDVAQDQKSFTAAADELVKTCGGGIAIEADAPSFKGWATYACKPIFDQLTKACNLGCRRPRARRGSGSERDVRRPD